MVKSYKYRIYPNKQQRELIKKTFGCCRYVYNYFLDIRIKAYQEHNKTLSYYETSKLLTELKNQEGMEWLKEVDAISLQSSLQDLDYAYQKFFKEHIGFPQFKTKKTNRFAYKTKNNENSIRIKNNHIRLSKLGWVKFRDKGFPKGKILHVTITQEPSGKYYASICCDNVDIEYFPKTNKNIGIDLGLKSFAITSDGVIYENHKYLRTSSNKLVKLQRSLSRKTIGGSNWNKQRIKLARLHEHIFNQRKDYLQKLSTQLVKENDVICIENLQIRNMLKNHKLACSIYDVAWYKFTTMLEYKADWHHKKVIRVSRFFPSSQICNCCGYKNSITKNLDIRKWTCPNCGNNLDRDINAAINLLNEGLRLL